MTSIIDEMYTYVSMFFTTLMEKKIDGVFILNFAYYTYDSGHTTHVIAYNQPSTRLEGSPRCT